MANSVSEPAALTLGQLRRVISHKPLAKIPFDPETINRAAGHGVCLFETDARAAATKSIQKLAAALCKSISQSDGEKGDHRTRPGQTLLSKIGFAAAGAGK